MTQEEKELLLKDICGRLPYGVKVLYEGWDSDHGCEYTTVEDLIGIDDRFIYTLWRGERQKHSIVGLLSITDYKPYLRPLSSMTDEEHEEYRKYVKEVNGFTYNINCSDLIDWFNRKMFDYRGLIPKGLALEAKDGMYNN